MDGVIKHNEGVMCKSCHSHDAGWEGSGTCDTCHGYPPAIGDGKTYKGTAYLGKGAHTKHVNHIKGVKTITLNKDVDAFGDANTTAVCGDCHDLSVGTNHMNGDNNRSMLVNPSYQFGGTAPAYNGAPGTTTTKSCSNVSCHFKTSPMWQNITSQND